MVAIAILGAGNGGFAAASHLHSHGASVRLYNRSAATIRSVQEVGGIGYSGVAGEGFAQISVITNELGVALAGTDLIIICLPAAAFAGLARDLAPLLDGSIPIILNPGSTGGALAMGGMLREAGCTAVPPIGETNTLTYICRKRGEGNVYISSLVRNVRFAALPASATEGLADQLRRFYPSLREQPSVLHTSLSNVNAVLHPPGIVLAAAWIEHSGGDFSYYYDAGTPAVAQVMADLDRERLAVAAAWGIELEPFPTMFADIGSTSEAAGRSGSYLRVLRESEPNKFIRAPASLEHRYLYEDIPFGVVPISELGRARGAGTPVADALITLASSMNRVDYRAQGWTLERLGLPAGQATEQVDYA